MTCVPVSRLLQSTHDLTLQTLPNLCLNSWFPTDGTSEDVSVSSFVVLDVPISSCWTNP